MITAVYGGSFDPCGLNHRMSALWLASRDDVREVLVIPSAAHSEKSTQTPYVHRLEMTHRGVGGLTKVTVSDAEERILATGHSGPVYAYTLLSYLRDQGVRNLRFAIGPDLIQRTKSWYLGDRVREEFGFIEIPHLTDFRATTVRESIRHGRRWEHMVPWKVAEYIKEKGLYA